MIYNEKKLQVLFKDWTGEKNITFKRNGRIAASRGRIILHPVLKTTPSEGAIYYDS